MTDKKRCLTLHVVVPDPPQRGASVEVRPLVDGEDILADVFTEGPGEDPKYLLLPDGPLTAATEPYEVRLAEATCTEECCGALYVTIRRDGDHVIWSEWRNPDENEVYLPELWFDAREYQAEVERAVADHSWEWPARTVARLLEQDLRERTDWLAQWECELGAVSAWLWEPDQINLFLFHPGRSATGKTAHGCSSGWCLPSPATTLRGRPGDLLSNSWRTTHVRQPKSAADHRSSPGSSVTPGRSDGESECGEYRTPAISDLHQYRWMMAEGALEC